SSHALWLLAPAYHARWPPARAAAASLPGPRSREERGWGSGRATSTTSRLIVLSSPVGARDEGIARLPQRREEQVMQRALHRGDRHAASASGLQAEVALRQLQVRRAEQMKLLVEVGQRLGAGIDRGPGARAGVEVYQVHLGEVERGGE